MKELTFNSTTLGWRFSHTEIFLQHFIKQWELLQDVGIKNLDEFWNIESASGTWLKTIGIDFHIERPQVLDGNMFILNLDRLNDPDVFLNGTPQDLADSLFRMVILMRSLSTMQLFTMPNIANTFTEVFGAENVKVEFRENTDLNDQPRERYFRMLIWFKRREDAKVFVGLQETNPLILIGKPMGIGYDIYAEYDPNLRTENVDAILCGQPERAYPMWNSYHGTDASITDPSVCYSYDNVNYTMYLDKTKTIEANAWCPLYADKQLQTVAAYIKSPNRIAPRDPSVSSLLLPRGGQVYFPQLGETDLNARECFIGRARIPTEE